MKEDSIWRSRYSHELYKLYNECDTVKVIKLRLFRMQDQNPCRN
jgi:hypothetical protein